MITLDRPHLRLLSGGRVRSTPVPLLRLSGTAVTEGVAFDGCGPPAALTLRWENVPCDVDGVTSCDLDVQRGAEHEFSLRLKRPVSVPRLRLGGGRVTLAFHLRRLQGTLTPWPVSICALSRLGSHAITQTGSEFRCTTLDTGAWWGAPRPFCRWMSFTLDGTCVWRRSKSQWVLVRTSDGAVMFVLDPPLRFVIDWVAADLVGLLGVSSREVRQLPSMLLLCSFNTRGPFCASPTGHMFLGGIGMDTVVFRRAGPGVVEPLPCQLPRGQLLIACVTAAGELLYHPRVPSSVFVLDVVGGTGSRALPGTFTPSVVLLHAVETGGVKLWRTDRCELFMIV